MTLNPQFFFSNFLSNKKFILLNSSFGPYSSNFFLFNLNIKLNHYFSYSTQTQKNKTIKKKEILSIKKKISDKNTSIYENYQDKPFFKYLGFKIIPQTKIINNNIIDNNVLLNASQYRSIFSRFRGMIMKNGKLTLANRIFTLFLYRLSKEFNQPGDKVLFEALSRIRPFVSLESRRVGGARYNLPRYVTTLGSYSIASRWLINRSRKSNGNFLDNLILELKRIKQGSSELIKLASDTHKIAINNRMFMRFGIKHQTLKEKMESNRKRKEDASSVIVKKDLINKKSSLIKYTNPKNKNKFF